MRQKGFVPLLLLPVILIGLVVVYGIYWYTGSILKSEEAITESTPSPSPATTSQTPIPDETANWQTYTNSNSGFSIKLPNEMSHGNGNCSWEDGNSYRPKDALVPVKIFENEGTVFISSEYYYALGDEKQIPQTIGSTYNYGSCTKVQNSVDKLKEQDNHYQQKWQMIVKTVNNDEELNDFIKSIYGENATIADKLSTQQMGTFDIKVNENRQGGGGGIAALKYSPTKNKVAFWGLGQACTFYKNLDIDGSCFDNMLVQSFRFIE